MKRGKPSTSVRRVARDIIAGDILSYQDQRLAYQAYQESLAQGTWDRTRQAPEEPQKRVYVVFGTDKPMMERMQRYASVFTSSSRKRTLPEEYLPMRCAMMDYVPGDSQLQQMVEGEPVFVIFHPTDDVRISDAYREKKHLVRRINIGWFLKKAEEKREDPAESGLESTLQPSQTPEDKKKQAG